MQRIIVICYLMASACACRVLVLGLICIRERARINQTACSYIYFGLTQTERGTEFNSRGAAAFALINPHRLQLIEVTPRARRCSAAENELTLR
jgi:hypothetical protein